MPRVPLHLPERVYDSPHKSLRNKSPVAPTVAKPVREADCPLPQFGRRSACPTMCFCLTGSPETCARSHSAGHWPFHVRQRVCEDCNDGGVLGQCFRHDFVQRISGSVVIIEIETTVLDRTESRHASFLHRRNISATMFDQSKHAPA